MISNEISILWITLKLLNLLSFLFLIFTGLQFEDNRLTTFAKKFRQAIAMINLIIIAQSFEIICIDISKFILAIDSKKNGFLRPVSTYFGMVETNSQEI